MGCVHHGCLVLAPGDSLTHVLEIINVSFKCRIALQGMCNLADFEADAGDVASLCRIEPALAQCDGVFRGLGTLGCAVHGLKRL